MMFSDKIFIGIDPSGGRKPFTFAVLDAAAKPLAMAEGEIDDVMAFIAAHPAVFAAVNAPPRPNQGKVREIRQSLPPLRAAGRSADMRLAEYQLRQHGINVSSTPARRDLCTNWVQTGFDLYQRLQGLGFESHPVDGGSRVWIETNPQASFAALLGQIPFPRTTLEGRLQRQLILYEHGLNIHDPMEFFEEITRHKLLKGALPLEQVYLPAQLDALAAAYVALACAKHPADVIRVGDPQEGQVVLPVRELKTKY